MTEATYNDKFKVATAETFNDQARAHMVVDGLADLFTEEKSFAHPFLIGQLQVAAFEQLDLDERQRAASAMIQLNTTQERTDPSMLEFAKDLTAAEPVDEIARLAKYPSFSFNHLLSILYGIRQSGADAMKLSKIAGSVNDLDIPAEVGAADNSAVENDRRMKATVVVGLMSELPQ